MAELTPDKVASTLVTMPEGAAPTPQAGVVSVYPKTDKLVYSKDDTGTERGMGPGSAALPEANRLRLGLRKGVRPVRQRQRAPVRH